jgi:quinol monooxygenase YgiN
MTNQTVQFIVSLAIHEGKHDGFAALAQAMSARTEQEPGALAYEFFLSPDRKQCRLVERYVDANAVLAHMTGPVVQQLVPKMLEVSDLTGFEVFGDPGSDAGKILGAVGAQIYGAWQGFSR